MTESTLSHTHTHTDSQTFSEATAVHSSSTVFQWRNQLPDDTRAQNGHTVEVILYARETRGLAPKLGEESVGEWVLL